MGRASCCLILLSFLIVTIFVGEIHGSKQGRALDKLQKAKIKESSGIDVSLFQAQEVHAAVVHNSQDGLKERDRIEKLPGQPEVKFDQYGGYVTVDKSAGRAFYYYFVEAQRSSEKMPLLLWLNGGIISLLAFF